LAFSAALWDLPKQKWTTREADRAEGSLVDPDGRFWRAGTALPHDRQMPQQLSRLARSRMRQLQDRASLPLDVPAARAAMRPAVSSYSAPGSFMRNVQGPKQQGPKENGSSAGARWGRQFRSKCTGAARCTSLNGPVCRRFLTHFNKCGRDAKPGCYAGRSQVFFKCCNASCYSKDERPVCAKGNTAICCGMKSIAMRQEIPALQGLLSASRHRNEAGDLGIIRSEKSEVCHEANARRRRTSPPRRH
jgi:hypothetical protein